MPRRFSVRDYYRMAETGILQPDERVELIEGEIIAMSPIRVRHAACVNKLNALFSAKAKSRWIVSPQNPVDLNPYSEPEPDITVLRFDKDFYAGGHPTPKDVLLLIEVADTTLGFDRGRKLPLYARDGIAEVWIVNLSDEVVEVYRGPQGETYLERRQFGRGENVAPGAFPEIEFPVAKILP